MDVSIVIVTRNTRDLTLNCLASLEEGLLSRAYQVVVVDNASTDGTGAAIAERYPQVKVLTEPHNVGFARANNDGAREARGALLLLFLNSDTVASVTAVETLGVALKRDPVLGAVCPQLVGADGRWQESASFVPTPATETRASIRRRARARVAAAVVRGDDLAGLGFLSGAALMVRREAFASVGGFDGSLFFYNEDTDLCVQLANRGWGLRVVPAATVVHLGGGSTRHALGAIELARSRYQYLRKHYGRRNALLVTGVQLLRRLRRALVDTVVTLLSLGCWPKVRRKALLHWRVCVWHLLLMPARDSWIYHRLVGDWQGAARDRPEVSPAPADEVRRHS